MAVCRRLHEVGHRLGGAAPIYTSGVRNVGMRINLIGNFRSTIHSVKVSSLAPPLFHNSIACTEVPKAIS